MNQQDRHNHLLRFQRFQKSRELYFAPKIFAAIRSQYTTVLKLLHSGYTEHEAINKISSAPIVEVLRPLYQDAATVYGAKIRADLNKLIPTRLSFYTPVIVKNHVLSVTVYREKGRMPIGFSDTMRQLIEQYFSIDLLNQSEGITDTTRELIRQVFTDAYQLGEGINDIVAKLENTELSRIRARLIARTESVTAANTGAIIVAKSTELDLNKQWLAASDNRVRHHHREVNKTVIGLNDFFQVGHDKMLHPGDRGGKNGQPLTSAENICNCRCTTLFIPID